MSISRLFTSALFRRFLQAQEGATAIEYALIASGVSIAIVGTVFGLGTQIKTTFYDKLTAVIK